MGPNASGTAGRGSPVATSSRSRLSPVRRAWANPKSAIAMRGIVSLTIDRVKPTLNYTMVSVDLGRAVLRVFSVRKSPCLRCARAPAAPRRGAGLLDRRDAGARGGYRVPSAFPSLREYPEPPTEELLDPRRELAAAPGVGGLLDDLGLGGVGMDDARDAAQADALGDRQTELAHHVAGVLGDQGGAEDLVGAALEVNAQEALVLAVEAGAVVVGEGPGQGVDLEAPAARGALVHPDLAALRAAPRAPPNRHPA